MIFPFGPSVTWLRRTVNGQDALGVDTYTTTGSVTVQGAFNPGPSIETVQGQDLVVDNPTLYLPPGTCPTAYDRFVVDGITYEVVGTPDQWKSPFTGWEPGTVVALQAVTG